MNGNWEITGIPAQGGLPIPAVDSDADRASKALMVAIELLRMIPAADVASIAVTCSPPHVYLHVDSTSCGRLAGPLGLTRDVGDLWTGTHRGVAIAIEGQW